MFKIFAIAPKIHPFSCLAGQNTELTRFDLGVPTYLQSI